MIGRYALTLIPAVIPEEAGGYRKNSDGVIKKGFFDVLGRLSKNCACHSVSLKMTFYDPFNGLCKSSDNLSERFLMAG